MNKRLKKVVSFAIAFSLILMMVVSIAGIAKAKGENGENKVRICHRTNAYNHPYNSIRVDYHSVDGDTTNNKGQGDHAVEHTGPVFNAITMNQHSNWGDIILPHHNFAGLNWSEGRSIWENNCRVKTPTPNPSVSRTPIPTPSETLTPSPEPSVTVTKTSGGKPKSKISPQVLGTTAPTATPIVAGVTEGEGLPVSGANVAMFNFLLAFSFSVIISYLLKVYGWKKIEKQ